ncbi:MULTISPECIES: PLP-dependent aminotransferase family protein [unclassified Caballeronia]|uniref:MocR-like pyridoxine biosynthesis transcription factor PdxR n=1 Tax=unclassified Caballeronia TaxID=2646786 RepID=UPI002028AC13|nr:MULTISPECIES: PLP-dependent aminotransferase family protein [unclassified Caballeronia]
MVQLKDAIGTGRRIYDLLRAQIADGTLPAGAPAPSTRALAADLGVSRTTVTAAYEQLAAEGFLVTSAGRVARVATPPMPLAPPIPARAERTAPALSAYGRRVSTLPMPVLAQVTKGSINFLYGAVSARDFPSLIWKRAYQAELLHQPDSLYYVAPEGDASLRRALQAYLGRARGLVCDSDQIVVVNGTQQALDLCARLLLDPGDAFAFEDPGYLIARHCFEASGGVALPVPVDEHGLDTRRLPADGRARLAYVTPSHQFPLGGVLPIGRRLELLEWAQRHDAWIIEDDYDGEFRYGQRPIDALQSIDTNGRVIYIGTFSKALSPHLRLGYMILPHDLVPAFRQAKRLADRHSAVIDQRVLAALIESGAYERHVRRVRREYERRRAALLDAIADLLPKRAHATGTAAGLHVTLWLPFIDAAHEAALVAAAHAKGVGVYPVSPLHVAPCGGTSNRTAGLILGYASVPVEQIRKGIEILADVIAHFRT